MICFTAIQVCNVLNNNSSSHMRSLTAYSFVSTAIGSVVISRERFEHELTRLAFKNIIGGPTLSEKDRHLCMRDERIRRDTCQNFLHKTPNFVTSEQCRVLIPSFRGLRMEHLGPWLPIWRQRTVCIFGLGLSYRSSSNKIRETEEIAWCSGGYLSSAKVCDLNTAFWVQLAELCLKYLLIKSVSSVFSRCFITLWRIFSLQW